MDTIVGCANDILATGDMDIYQRTYEQLQHALTPKVRPYIICILSTSNENNYLDVKIWNMA